ncbi:MAG: thiamine phosphate synthase [Candidatus Eisenbacteria bacterium]|nr:thiamine phosphate synthase [Candidatus Eisenbacteria bacterium]
MTGIPRFYLISDRRRMGCDPIAAVSAMARAGLPAFQWREKDLAAIQIYEAAQAFVASFRAQGSPTQLLVSDRVDIALAIGCGVHLPEGGLPTRIARALLPAGALLLRSTHSLAGAERARDEGADAVTFSPVFDTASKRAFGPPQGLASLQRVCEALAPFPVLALGGITLERTAACLDAGAHGVAVIGAVWDAADPAEAARKFAALCVPRPAAS